MSQNTNAVTRNINIGTLGHVDHGKTTLTAALWTYFGGVQKDIKDVDNHKEERERGITINTRTVQYTVNGVDAAGSSVTVTCSHVDCPGHADFIKNMITGASKLDVTLLVISAFDGPQAQTKEHIKIASIIGIKYFIVILNKVDQIDPADLDDFVALVMSEVLDLLMSNKILKENITFVKISATLALKEVQGHETPTEYGILALKEIAQKIVDVPPIDYTEKNNMPFRMTIEDTYSITGRGTVVAGKVDCGTLKIGESLELITKKKTMMVTVTSMECFNKQRTLISTGDNAALLVKVERSEIERGSIICKKGAVQLVHYAKVQLYLFPPEDGGRKTAVGVGYIPNTFVGPRETPTEILQTETELLEPGSTSICHIACLTSMPFIPGIQMIIRESNSTIGVAIIMEGFSECPVDVKGRKSTILDVILKAPRAAAGK